MKNIFGKLHLYYGKKLLPQKEIISYIHIPSNLLHRKHIQTYRMGSLCFLEDREGECKNYNAKNAIENS